jgi:predicted esterase
MNKYVMARRVHATAAALALAAALAAGGAYGGEEAAIDPLAADAGDFLEVDVSQYMIQAEAAYREGRYEDAARLYLTYLRSDVYDGRVIYNLACCYGLLGEADLAATNLRRAYDAGFTDVSFAAEDPDFDAVRDVEPFASTLAELRAEGEINGDAETLYLQAPAILPCYVVLPEGYDSAEPRTLVVALHGVGGAAVDFATLWNKFAEPDFILAVPEAPYALPLRRGLGYSWRADVPQLESVTRESYSASGRYVLDLVGALRGQYAVGDVYLLGFSQGAGLAYAVAIKNPAAFKGLICCSGPFTSVALSAEELAAGSALRVFISQGEDDREITRDESEAAYEALAAFGYEVTYRSFEGGHGIPRDVAAEIGKWITE